MRDMVWNVYVGNFNGRCIETYNIFRHCRFFDDVKRIYKKYKNDFDKFSEEIKRSLMYYFWSKCEWEITLGSWPPRDNFQDEKIDVYDQVMMNWDVFIKYVWDMCHARKLPVRKAELSNVVNDGSLADDSCGSMSENDLRKIFGWMEEAEKEFRKSHQSMPGPKYKKGDVVRFKFFDDREPFEGMVEIVDAYGTFEQNEEPSYDIYKFDNNTLYKHVRESLVTEFIRSGSLSEIEENIKKFD